MDTQTLINVGAGAVLSAMGWLSRQLWDAVQRLKEDVHKIEVELPSHYVRREEFFDAVREIKEICDKIYKKIDDIEQRKQNKE